MVPQRAKTAIKAGSRGGEGRSAPSRAFARALQNAVISRLSFRSSFAARAFLVWLLLRAHSKAMAQVRSPGSSTAGSQKYRKEGAAKLRLEKCRFVFEQSSSQNVPGR
jgi:hypothetical protein